MQLHEIRVPLYSVVIPTYGSNGVTLTQECLTSMTQWCFQPHEVIVVDDGSGDAVQSVLAQVCDKHGATLVPREDNGGFAKACNSGILGANGSVVILLNNDVRLISPALDYLADSVLAMGAGIMGCKLLYPDDRIQHAGIYFQPTEGPWPGYFDHYCRFQKRYYPNAIVNRKRLVTGALMCIHRKTLNIIGLLDERFGMAAEDVDYQLNAMVAGLSVVYNGAVEAYHLEGQTRGVTPEQKMKMAPEAFEKEQQGLTLLFDKWQGLSWEPFERRGV